MAVVIIGRSGAFQTVSARTVSTILTYTPLDKPSHRLASGMMWVVAAMVSQEMAGNVPLPLMPPLWLLPPWVTVPWISHSHGRTSRMPSAAAGTEAAVTAGEHFRPFPPALPPPPTAPRQKVIWRWRKLEWHNSPWGQLVTYKVLLATIWLIAQLFSWERWRSD